jgi:hypothetical protein
MQTLCNISGISIDEIWLYSVELFERQVKFFDLKVESEYQEQKEESKLQEAIEKARRKANIN